MKNILKGTLLLALLLNFSAFSTSFVLPSHEATCSNCVNDQLTVTFPTSTSANMSWTLGGTGTGYSVIVTNLNTSAVEHSFTTGTTSATVGSLTTGHLYRFEVWRGSNSIVIDDMVL